jgi:hypothetical protein
VSRDLLVPPAGFALFGAYPGHGDSDPAAWEAMAGRQLALWTRYYEVQQTWPTADDLALINAGRTLYAVITPSNVIGDITWAEIAAGTYDSYFSAAATIIRDNGVPVIVAWDAEPDDTEREPSGTAAEYVASYQHVQALFAGITPLIIMAWVVSEGSTRSATFWPGASVVDWAGVDPYDETESKGGSGEPADGPQDTYKTFMSWLPAQGFGWTGPVGIFETGVDNTVSDANRATWIENVPAALADLGYSAWTWFNSGGNLGTTTISPAADPLAAAAIATIGASSVFNPPAPGPPDEPYLIGTAESDAASNTLVIDVEQTTNPGDGIAVGATINSASATVTGVTDTQSNSYSLEVHNSGTAEYGNAIYVSQGTTQLVAGTDQVTITFSSSLADGKSAGATGIPGALSSGAVDSAACVSATSAGSADPSVTTGVLAQQDEAIVAWLANGSGGGAVDWAATWTPQATGFQAAGGNQWSSMATLVTSATTAVTASGSITSAKWAILTAGIKLGVSLAVTTASLPEADTGAPYDQALTASGGVAPYTWAVTSGSLPSGLSLSSAGVITGTAGTPGTSGFTAKVTDADSNTATASLSLTVTLNLAVTTVSLPDGTTGAAYSQALTATGGTAPYSWSVSAGSLPAGLTLPSGGTISGTPTTAGTSSFTVVVTDTDGNTATQALSLAVVAELAVTTTTLPAGVAGGPYSQTLAAAGGTTPYAWSLASGALPAGVFLSSAGVISGTPSATGDFSFTAEVTDADADTATQALSLAITADLTVTTLFLAAAITGSAYRAALTAAGGTAPYSWSVTAGSLPAGLALAGTGVISGTPAVPGTSSFTVEVTDADSDTASLALSIIVAGALPASPFVPGMARPGRAVPGLAAGSTPAPPPPPEPTALVVNQWAGTLAQPPVFASVPAPCASVVVALDEASSVGGGSGTPTAGNWLFCIAAWNAAGADPLAPVIPPVTVSVRDDSHQWWRPAPPSPAAGGTRTAVWYQPDIIPPASVYVAPTGFAPGTAVLVVEVAGLGPWDVVTGTDSGFGIDAESQALSLGAPSGPALVLAAVSANSTTAGLTFAPSGYETLATVTASNGTDHTSDVTLEAAVVVTSAAQSVTASSFEPADLSGFIIGVLTAAPSPVPAGLNPNWPYVVFEFAPGSGYGTPPDQRTWVNLQSPENGRRLRSWKEETGPQYELDALESSEISLGIDNPDGHLSPWNPASPWYPHVVPGTPVRIRAIPPAAAETDRWYVIERNMERWPQGWDKWFRGLSNATATDAWSVVNKTLPTCYRAQVLANGPGWWWPCDDSGVNNATTLVNAAPGNSNPLVITASPGGPSAVLTDYPFDGAVTTYSAVPAFAQSQGWMYGDPDSAAFQVSGCGSTAHGYYLACTDPDFPPVTGNGVTIEGWWNTDLFDPDGQGAQVQGLYGQPDANLILWQLQDADGNAVASLYLAQSSGNLTFATWGPGGTSEANNVVGTIDARDGAWLGVTVTITGFSEADDGIWTVTVNAGAAQNGTAASLAPSFASFYSLGAPAGLVAAGCCNASAAHLAIYPYALTQQQVIASQAAAYTAFGQMPSPVIAAQFISNPGDGSPTVYAPDGELKGGQGFTAPGGGGGASLGAVACAVGGPGNEITSAPSYPATVLTVLPSDSPPGFCWLSAGSGTSTEGSFAAPAYAWFTGSSHGAELMDDPLADATAVPFNYVNSYGTGSAPPAQATPLGDTVQGRIERLLQAGQATGPRCIDPASEPVLAELDTGGQQCGQAIGNIVTSDDGLLFVDNTNAVCYWQRSHLAAQQTVWVLGPGTSTGSGGYTATYTATYPAGQGSGQIPFKASEDALDTDPQRVLNDIAVTQYDITQAAAQAQSGLSTGSGEPAGGLVFAPSASLYPEVQESLEQNGDCQYAITSYLQSTDAIQAQCDWLFGQYGNPVQRITSLVVNAAAMTRTCPQAWLFVLGLNVGDLIQAVFTWPGQPPVTGTWRVTHFTRTIDFAAGQASVDLEADYAPTAWWGVSTLPVMQDEAGATITDEQGGWLE